MTLLEGVVECSQECTQAYLWKGMLHSRWKKLPLKTQITAENRHDHRYIQAWSKHPASSVELQITSSGFKGSLGKYKNVQQGIASALLQSLVDRITLKLQMPE